MRPAYQIVMDALEIGLEVKLGQYTYALMEGTDAQNRDGRMLCIKMWNDTRQEPHYINPEMTFNDFLRECDKLTEKDLLLIGANVVLNRKYTRSAPAERVAKTCPKGCPDVRDAGFCLRKQGVPGAGGSFGDYCECECHR